MFISYAGPDEAIAEQLHRLLTERGKRAYFHPESVQAGDEWRKDIPRHIEASAVTVVLLSEQSATAWYQDSEVNVAVDAARYHQRRVVPVRLVSDVDLPFGLERVQAIDAWEATGLATAADRIVAALDRPDEHENPLRRPIVSDRIPHISRWFTGRDDLLDQLVDVWRRGGSRVLTQLINGMGGVGKSTVAAALAERVRVDADVVWWLRSDQETSLIDDVIELADRLGIAELDDRRERARQTIRHLSESDLRWLLVFDNAESERLIAPWVPRSGRGLSLVTTRDRTMTQLGSTIDVDVLPNDVAAGFLLDRVSESDAAAADDRDGATAVAGLVQGLPLALEQAGAWVAKSPAYTFTGFADRFRGAAQNPFPDGTVPIGYESTTWASIQVSLDAAAELSSLAEPLWHVLGWLAPNDIPIEWLTAIAEGDFFDADADGVQDAIVALGTFSLLTVSDDGATIDEVHRVVQAAARRAARHESGIAAVAALCEVSPGSGEDRSTWGINRALLPSALAVRDHGAGVPDMAAEICELVGSCANAVRFGGDPLDAIAIFEANKAFASRHLGASHPSMLGAMENLAGAYWSVGRTADALAEIEPVVQIRSDVLPAGHPDTLKAMSFRATFLLSSGRVGEALELAEHVLRSRLAVLGPHHPDVLTSKSVVVSALTAAGRLDEAIARGREVLAERNDRLGPGHHDSLRSKVMLASALRSAGRHDEAISLGEEVVATRVELVGDGHPATLTARSRLASALRSAGRLDEAIELAEEVLAARSELLGDRHPDTLTSRSVLASALRSADRHADAIALGEELVRDRTDVLGPVHPYTLTSRANLAKAYWSAGRSDAAVAMMSASITDAEQLDHEHRRLASWRRTLADWTAS